MRNKSKIENGKLARTNKLLLSLCCSAFGLLVAVSCVKDTPVYNEKEIRFGITNVSRALVTDMSNLEDQEVGVYGYYTATERWVWSTLNVTPNLTANYFFNKKLEYDGTEWGYGTPKYWPPDTINKISFFAYAPYVDVSGANGITPYPSAKTDAGSPFLNYVVPANVNDQVDLIWDSKIDMSHAHAPVMFDMKHALTRISFTAAFATSESSKNYTAKIKEISLSGVHGQGDLDLVTGIWYPYTLVPPKADYVLQDGPAGTLIDVPFNSTNYATDYDPKPLIKDNHYLMLIPQNITDETILNFTLEITIQSPPSVPVTTAIAVPLKPIIAKWEPGQAVEFNLVIKGDFIAVVTNLTSWRLPIDPSTGNVDF